MQSGNNPSRYQRGRPGFAPHTGAGAALSIYPVRWWAAIPQERATHYLQAARVRLFRVGRGGWGRGILLLGLLAPIFLAGCSTPRIVAGDSTNQTFYLKQRVATF
jgi:hypothetical protein